MQGVPLLCSEYRLSKAEMLGIPVTGTQTTGKGWQRAVRLSKGTGERLGNNERQSNKMRLG